MANTITAQDIETQLRDELGLTENTSLIAHISLPALGAVEGGERAIVTALLAAAGTVVMPAFTYQTQVIPQVGPPDNAIRYGTGDQINRKAEIFRPDLPVHPDCGLVAEVLRRDAETLRSTHPIFSFIAQGAHARHVLASQTRQNPLAPIAWLEAHDGVVLLMGADQRENFSLHLAEQRAGRKTFTRWALTLDDIEELPNIPGCREGFNAIWIELVEMTTVTHIGMGRCEVIPLEPLLRYTEKRLRDNPNFLLCDKPSCLSCRTREK
ncbi:MAG: AAC(3) family N-acetyltransferase [Anaerolineae bacterium]|nr:AAC(3) family N-acetyltransferase [Anaerolineae bacterium]